jgi:hypothetical protein
MLVWVTVPEGKVDNCLATPDSGYPASCTVASRGSALLHSEFSDGVWTI